MLSLISISLFVLSSALCLWRRKGKLEYLPRITPQGLGNALFADPLSNGPVREKERITVHGVPSYFVMPDVVSHCKYAVRCNSHGEEQARASVQWIAELSELSKEKRRSFAAWKLGELAALLFPDADSFHLRVCADWMNYIFITDDWLEQLSVDDNHTIEQCCMDVMRDPINSQPTVKGAILTKSWFSRLEQASSLACKERMMDAMLEFFRSLAQQAAIRTDGLIPDIETYMSIRRRTVGTKPGFVLIQFCGGYILPDEVQQHPVIQSLEMAVIDHTCCVNDLVSYNVEQARGDDHNLVTVVLKNKVLSLQEATDFVGDKCNECIDRFERDRLLLPSWNPDVNEVVAKYIDGLEAWMAGHVSWCFTTGRYFGDKGSDIMKHRIVQLLPKKSACIDMS